MVEAGLVKLSPGPDDQQMVSLTEEGEKVALETEQEIARLRAGNEQ